MGLTSVPSFLSVFFMGPFLLDFFSHGIGIFSATDWLFVSPIVFSPFICALSIVFLLYRGSFGRTKSFTFVPYLSGFILGLIGIMIWFFFAMGLALIGGLAGD